MRHTYQITGMTCESCEAKVRSTLLSTDGVLDAKVSKTTNTAEISMDGHISIQTFQQALGGDTSKYKISAISHDEATENAKSWLATYKPILLIFGYISAVTLIIQMNQDFNPMQAMQHFMAGFFLTFSFFKMLDLKGFAESYAMYDVIAMRLPVWGYLYAFIELGLGIAFAANVAPLVVNIVTFVVMSVSIIGVIRSVMDRKKIKCACLGAVFNLPMSTVTIIEDALMIAMSTVMIFQMVSL